MDVEPPFKCSALVLLERAAAIIGQLFGLALALVTALLSLRDRKRGRRLALGGVIVGFVATGAFALIGVIQFPL